MYIVNKTSAIQVEASASQATPAEQATLAAESATHDAIDAIGQATRWAARPLKLHHLTCMGVRRKDETLQVAVLQRGRREWREAHQVLTSAQLQRWLAEGFVRGR